MIGGTLQKAQYAALKANPPIADGAVFDRVPESAKGTFPRITIGDEQVIDDGTTCGDAWEVFSDVHVWSRPVAGSKLEAKDLGAAIKARLATTLTVEGFDVISATIETMRSFRDPDGQTEHAVLTFRYLLNPKE